MHTYMSEVIDSDMWPELVLPWLFPCWCVAAPAHPARIDR